MSRVFVGSRDERQLPRPRWVRSLPLMPDNSRDLWVSVSLFVLIMALGVGSIVAVRW